MFRRRLPFNWGLAFKPALPLSQGAQPKLELRNRAY